MKKLLIMVACLYVTGIGSSLAANSSDFLASPGDTVVVRNYDEIDEEELQRDTVAQKHQNTATGFNALDYVLDGRYRKYRYGEEFTRRWDDHLFLEAGASVEKIVPPASSYSFDVLTGAHVGVGKQFSPLHSLRLSLGFSYGYQRFFDTGIAKLYGRLDYLLSLSSYFGGYRPDRLLDVSAVPGVGGQYSKVERHDGTAFSPEAHFGAQLKFFTGPQGYLVLEPYAGISTDQVDISRDRNWRKYDLFYGLNVGLVYYLHNNLSPQSRAKYIRQRKPENYLVADSVLQSWRLPWFVGFANGVSFLTKQQLSTGKTAGPSVDVFVGKWFSPAIGLRLSAIMRSSVWRQEISEAATSPYIPAYTKNYNSFYTGARLEGMLNPLGLTKNYKWNQPFGFYFLFGGEIGRLLKYQSGEHLNCTSESYTAGLHLWTRLSTDLSLFLEPRFTHNVYKIPYSNVDWNELFSDNGFTISLGVSMMLRTPRYRQPLDHVYELEVKQPKWTIGIAGGTSLVVTKTPVFDNSGNSGAWNGLLFADYHFNNMAGVRLGVEWLNRADSGMSDFIDRTVVESEPTEVERTGLWNHTYRALLTSIGFYVDITRLMGGFVRQRTCELNMFVGPTIATSFPEKAELDSSERLQEGHEATLREPVSRTVGMGWHWGLKLSVNLSRHISTVLLPTVYLINSRFLKGVEMPRIVGMKAFETLNVGLQYKL